MAEFGGLELTNAGRTIIAKALTGKPLKFTRACAGDGYISEDTNVRTMTDIIKPHRDMEIAKMNIPPFIGTAEITVILNNKDMTAGFFFREVGLFAEDPDTGEEVLYGYCNAGDFADYMPGYGGADTVYYNLNLTVIVDQAKNVTAVFSENPLAVTYQQLDDRTDEIYREFRKREDKLQHQLNCLAQASILNSIEHMGHKHWQG